MASTDPAMNTSTPQPDLDSQLNSLDPSSSTDSPPVEITIKFPPEKYDQVWKFDATDTFQTIIESLTLELPEYDWSKSKALLSRPSNISKSLLLASSDLSLPVTTLASLSLRFLAPKMTDLAALQAAREAAQTLASRRVQARTRFSRLPQSSRRPSMAAATYTFQSISVLPHLPSPSRSRALLERLKTDPGIVATMQKHHFTVGLLTEMDPLQHTAASHEGVTRILGLNRNKGEVIELRLRTDAYDGYRNYRDIRKTLCHELSHNVHWNHDSEFWKLTRQIEKEVEMADWKSGGRTVGDEEFYEPPGGEEEDEEFMDHGGWEGGTYILGGGGSSVGNPQGLTEREVRARAAEARWANLEKATRREGPEGSDGGQK
ncbi:DNA-dependent metalloprotease WSS1 [Podospora australis]|uniref:DNA-dependent metalloprotease WSS1 n=1 Tax=Podospora australis TaxID=1536484 RepID=A0AAN6WWY6_9PEZI|nr:DNA-dependent metalloprotease WSS1 [Podospora australis]